MVAGGAGVAVVVVGVEVAVASPTPAAVVVALGMPSRVVAVVVPPPSPPSPSPPPDLCDGSPTTAPLSRSGMVGCGCLGHNVEISLAQQHTQKRWTQHKLCWEGLPRKDPPLSLMS